MIRLPPLRAPASSLIEPQIKTEIVLAGPALDDPRAGLETVGGDLDNAAGGIRRFDRDQRDVRADFFEQGRFGQLGLPEEDEPYEVGAHPAVAGVRTAVRTGFWPGHASARSFRDYTRGW